MKVEYVIAALKEHFEAEEVEDAGGHTFLIDGDEYEVYDEDDADTIFMERVNDYVQYELKDECPDQFQNYVDWDQFASDYADGCCRADWLAPYDSEEHEVVDEKGNYWYVYRQ